MIEARHLTKFFGQKAALDDISFTVEKGEVLGFLGPWLYVIPKWQHDAFITDLEQLLERSDESRAKNNALR